ncbi:thioesterase [Streptomyces corchorusii]|uniref:Thioesterase n=2 Tax=Streptomyces TaxID=1883 RepID=A0A101QD72_STRCK|nr:thioesterase [Streptomyces hygroscopicus subsp. jinggangensis 5008]AGF61285.1 thioesterase [Streptomyces hygroscopicus subsp. jinggangensis TL01]ALO91552.1 Thioesterase [Streptomyces hygroscopicus subsp. limoneus]KUN27797.1 thioesterase [Streptomyces corchorusii]
MWSMPPGSRPNKMLLRPPKQDSRARLFCFPYSGLGASMYNKWPDQVDGVEICRVQPPGRENRYREPHYGTYEELAEQVTEALLPHLDRPFAFFGHCGGALPGFATALHLARAGLPTPHTLFISSQVAPHDGPFGRFLQLTNSELAVELAELTRAMGGTPSPDMIQMSLRVLRADITANQRYHLTEPVLLPCAVHVIGWSEDKEIRPEQMGGWHAYAEDGRYAETTLEGGHHAFLDAPCELLTTLTERLCSAEPFG